MGKKIIIVVIVLLIMAMGYVYISKGQAENFEFYNIENMYTLKSYVVKKGQANENIKSSGIITDFNIKKLDVDSDYTISTFYVEDGAIVSERQKVLKIKETSQNVRAPINGIFLKQKNENGEFEYKIYDINQVGISIYLLEEDVSKISIGQEVVVKIITLNEEVTGQIQYISKIANEEGKFGVDIKIPYTENLRFGYTASVSVTTKQNSETLLIPSECINVDEYGRYYVVKEEYKDNYNELSEEMKTYIEIGIIENDMVEILEGLNENDRIIYMEY